MVSLLLCLLDWCMAVPLVTLLEPITMPVLDDPASQKTPLLDYIYRVRHVEPFESIFFVLFCYVLEGFFLLL